MDTSDEKNCDGVTHACDPNVKFGCKDSGEESCIECNPNVLLTVFCSTVCFREINT